MRRPRPPQAKPLAQRWVQAWVHELRLALIALQFFTRVPVPAWVGFEPAWLQHSARHFPLVGLCVGTVAALVLWSASLLFAPAVAVGLSMAASVLLTGAFHEDGLADTCDALGGVVSRERALAIMKDSRIGTYGSVALMLVLGLKAAALLALPQAATLMALVLAHSASRAAAVLLMRALPYVGDASQSKLPVVPARLGRGAVAAAWGWVGASVVGVGAMALALGVPVRAWGTAVALSMAALLVCAVACGRWFARRLGGVTGDTLGATQQLAELSILLVWAAVWPKLGA